MTGAGPEEWECNDGFFFFVEVRKLRTGVLDEDAEHVFTCGHCHSFAEAVRRLTAAELVFAFDRIEGAAQGHVLVRIGRRYLDARGWVAEQLTATDGDRSFERQWDEVRVIGREGWLEISAGWLEPRVEDAMPFARTLLERLGIPIDGDSEIARGGKEVCGCIGSCPPFGGPRVCPSDSASAEAQGE